MSGEGHRLRSERATYRGQPGADGRLALQGRLSKARDGIIRRLLKARGSVEVILWPGCGAAFVIISVMKTLLGGERKGRDIWRRVGHDCEGVVDLISVVARKRGEKGNGQRKVGKEEMQIQALPKSHQ